MPTTSSRRLPCVALALAGLLGCADAGGLDPSRDEGAPVLIVDFPIRGAPVSGGEVFVSGTARDEEGDVARVYVLDTEVDVDSTGHFETTIELEPGIHVLETVARDGSQNEATDYRAVLIGEMAPANQGALDSVAAFLPQSSLDVIAEGVEPIIKDIDFTELVASQNPVFSKGSGCFRLSADVENIEYEELHVVATAMPGALEIAVVVDKPHVDILGDYRIACAGGKQSIDVDADELVIVGDLVLEVIDREVVARLKDAKVTHQGLKTRLGIPGLDQLADALDSKIVDSFAGSLLGQLESTLAETVDSWVNRSYTQTIDDIDFRYRLWPRSFEAAVAGLTIVTDIQAWTDLNREVEFLSTPSPRPADWNQGESIRALISDDGLTHILSVVWNSGLLRRDLPASELGLDIPGITRLELKPLLPPIADVGDSAQVVIGDMLVSLYAESGGGEELALTLAVTGRLDVSASAPDGQLSLELGIADLHINLLEERPIASEILDVRSVTALAEAGLKVALGRVESSLTFEIPGFFGLSLVDLSLAPEPGHALISGRIE